MKLAKSLFIMVIISVFSMSAYSQKRQIDAKTKKFFYEGVVKVDPQPIPDSVSKEAIFRKAQLWFEKKEPTFDISYLSHDKRNGVLKGKGMLDLQDEKNLELGQIWDNKLAFKITIHTKAGEYRYRVDDLVYFFDNPARRQYTKNEGKGAATEKLSTPLEGLKKENVYQDADRQIALVLDNLKLFVKGATAEQIVEIK